MIKFMLPIGIAGTDYLVKKHRDENQGTSYKLNEHVKILTYHNKGAFLNLGQKRPALVMLLSAIMTAVLTVVFAVTFTFKGKKLLKLGLGMLLGGAFSNSYDRISKGYVVDYLNFPKAPGLIRNVIFNLSDFAIIIGAFISACSI